MYTVFVEFMSYNENSYYQTDKIYTYIHIY